jgi:hypothetical protein
MGGSSNYSHPKFPYIDRESLLLECGVKFIFTVFNKFDTLSKNIKYNENENIESLIQINLIDFSIRSNPTLTTHH